MFKTTSRKLLTAGMLASGLVAGCWAGYELGENRIEERLACASWLDGKSGQTTDLSVFCRPFEDAIPHHDAKVEIPGVFGMPTITGSVTEYELPSKEQFLASQPSDLETRASYIALGGLGGVGLTGALMLVYAGPLYGRQNSVQQTT